ncbi:WD40-repeat-containing domain protein [Aspergillus minisclerotigenes]|uniref:WD40-repeat-containing domain protein n=1 Tax=Aspergillus minisclerotigenes TaxID=656917 RepID=A0A5N6ISQ0_9EURO|nr:WD40-repeat-containing domain protein [Aspergillus minisclerotigenes]
MAKRKREETTKDARVSSQQPSKVVKSTTSHELPSSSVDLPAVTLQIITGSYERVLHGFTAAIPPSCFSSSEEKDSSAHSSAVQFIDTFLFEAHASAIRCLALSPRPNADSTEDSPKVILASGATDETIKLYSLSAAPLEVNEQYPSIPTLAGNKILENPKNRELGTLLHHSSSISALHFPSRSKLLAASEDNTISVTRTRDFAVVSTIKAPRPKVQGRPSGDTAPPGGSPSGVNDFAVHPSMKLMLSVGKGEKCMRLWNLVTGKKAGVLNFSREILQAVKEGKWSTGEGRKIVWDSKGEEFAVAFEWGAVVFGIDSTPICRIFPSPRSKIHQMKYINKDPSAEDGDELLAVSTEDGRVIFYSTKKVQKPQDEDDSPIPYAEAVAELGGKASGFSGRVKDFEILSLKNETAGPQDGFLVVTGNSEGVIRVWYVPGEDLAGKGKGGKTSKTKDEKASKTPQVGKFLNAYETGNRITCLKGFVMLPSEDPSSLLDSEEEFEGLDSDEENESESEESDA